MTLGSWNQNADGQLVSLVRGIRILGIERCGNQVSWDVKSEVEELCDGRRQPLGAFQSSARQAKRPRKPMRVVSTSRGHGTSGSARIQGVAWSCLQFCVFLRLFLHFLGGEGGGGEGVAGPQRRNASF